MKPLHVLDMSLPHVAGYTTRARSILEGQRNLGMDPAALTGLRQTLNGNTEASVLPLPQPCEEINSIRYYRTWQSGWFRRTAKLPIARELAEMTLLHRRIVEVA